MIVTADELSKDDRTIYRSFGRSPSVVPDRDSGTLLTVWFRLNSSDRLSLIDRKRKKILRRTRFLKPAIIR